MYPRPSTDDLPQRVEESHVTTGLQVRRSERQEQLLEVCVEPLREESDPTPVKTRKLIDEQTQEVALRVSCRGTVVQDEYPTTVDQVVCRKMDSHPSTSPVREPDLGRTSSRR